MTEFTSRQISPPLSWEEFESLCCDLWTEILSDQNTSKNGRSGQKQHGVDVFGRVGGNGKWVGVQCKGKDGRYGKEVSEKELNSEVEKAKSFKPRISQFILATTADSDAKIQEVARKLTETHAESGLFSVTVFGWSELLRKLASHEHLIEKYYPGQSLRFESIEGKLESLVDASLQSNSHATETHHQLASLTAEIASLRSAISIDDGGNRESKETEADALSAEIDGYRETLISGKSATAKELLGKLKERAWDTASERIKFRLVTNIAACDLRLDNISEAIQGFRQAFQYAEDDEVAHGNLILADILEKDYAAAQQKAAMSIESFPDSEIITSYYISTYPGEGEDFVPEEFAGDRATTSGVVAYGIYGYYKNCNDLSAALDWLSKAYELDSDKFEIRLSYATEILEEISTDKSFLVGKQTTAEKENLLARSKDILLELFEEAANSEEHTSIELIANNLALCCRILGSSDEGISVIDRALHLTAGDEQLEKLKIALHIDLEHWTLANSLLDNVESENDFQFLLMKIESYRALDKCAEAQGEIQAFLNQNPDTQERDILVAYTAELIYRDSGFSAAEAFGNKEIENQGGLHTRITMAKICRWNDDLSEAQARVTECLPLIDESSSYEDQLLVAEEAYYCDLLGPALGILQQLVSSYTDSPPLRRLIACLYEMDDREGLCELLLKLPQETKHLPYYTKYAAAYYTRVGDDRNAEIELERYLLDHPSDLNAALNKIGILWRTDRKEEAKAYLDSLRDFDSEPPLDQMHLAFAYSELAREREAIDLAYELRRKFCDNSEIHLKYLGLVLSGKINNAIEEPKEVMLGTSVRVRKEEGEYEYYVCDTNENPANDNELAPEHPISVAVLGSKVGEVVEFEESPVMTRELKVLEIRSKYLYMHFDTMNGFSHRFPGTTSFYKLELKTDKEGNPDFTPIFASLDQRRTYVDHGFDLYRNSPLPVAMLAQYLGVNPLSLWFGLQNHDSEKIYCAQGTLEEREFALELVRRTNKYVVDPLTAIQLVDMGLTHDIQQIAGNLLLAKSSIDLVNNLIEDERRFEGQDSMTLAKEGANYVKYEDPVEEKQRRVEYLENIKERLSSDFQLITAVGRAPKSGEFLQFFSGIDSSFIDTLFIAANEGHTLLSDDMRLRAIATLGWDIDSTWIQPVLLELRHQGIIPVSKYADVIYEYIRRNYEFISVDKDILFHLAEEEGFKPGPKFSLACGNLGLENSDLASSISVAAGTINAISRDFRDDRKYEAYVYSILNAMTAGCTRTYTSDLLRYMDQVTARSVPGPLSASIRKWAQGHFLTGLF